jgi:hypothetical protein
LERSRSPLAQPSVRPWQTQVTGEVTDPTGAPIAEATVKMVETEKGVSHETKTDANGRYTLPNLPVGPYRLESSMTGFKTYTQTYLSDP